MPEELLYRTDENRNPTAFTTALAEEAGLVKGVDYEDGTPFPAPATLKTAKILGDPIEVTCRLLDRVGFFTESGGLRWLYIGLPQYLWDHLSLSEAIDIIGWMYEHEGGTAMRDLFPNYGKLK
jgi:hypothetical protein